MSNRVVIIGAGIGGIATANLLAKAGYQVTVYEKNDQPGGRAGTLTIDGFTFDTGPSWYLMPDVFAHYFSLFDLSVSDELGLVKLTPAYKVFFEHAKPLIVSGNEHEDAATFESIEPGAGRRLLSYINRSDAIYRLSLRHFLYTNFSSHRDFLNQSVVRHGVSMAKLAATPLDRFVRRFVKDRRLRQILEYPMVFLGTSPFTAPAIYSLMSALDFREGVFYPRGGLYQVIERLTALSADLGVHYHYNTSVRRIIIEDKKAVGLVLEGGIKISADIVISNADLHFTETKLLSKENRSYPEQYWQKREAGPSALLMYLGVSGKLPQLEHHNLFFVDDWKQNFDDIFAHKKLPEAASVYICKPSATDTSVAPKGHENLFVLVPLPTDMPIDADQIEAVADRYLRVIADKFTIPNLQERLVVKKLFGPNDFRSKFNAWQGTALGPSHRLRQSALFRTSNKSRKVQDLYYVGSSTLPGIGLPMCLISAEILYKRLAGDRRSGPISNIRKLV